MLRLLVFTFGVWLYTAHAQAQTALMNLQVTDRRPVEAAVLELTSHYPVVITYEDPQFRYAGDVEELTDQARKKYPNARGLIGPRVGTLHANYEVSQETGELANVSAALANIVNAKNADAVGGRFTFLQIGDVYHVIPTEIRDSYALHRGPPRKALGRWRRDAARQSPHAVPLPPSARARARFWSPRH